MSTDLDVLGSGGTRSGLGPRPRLRDVSGRVRDRKAVEGRRVGEAKE